jgi:hypothetical protein
MAGAAMTLAAAPKPAPAMNLRLSIFLSLLGVKS